VEAEQVLRKLHPHSAGRAAEYVAGIQTAIAAEETAYVNGGWHTILHPAPAVKRALLAALGIAAIQQLSGIEALTSYFVFIFQRARLQTSGAYVFLILFGVCKLLTVYLASRWFDSPRCGRRPLLLLSGAGVFLCMVLFALLFSFPITQASTVVTVITMFIYVIAYSVGYGPGAWVVMLEALPMQIRAKGLSLCTFLNRVIATLLSGSFLSLVRYMRYAGYFWLFSALTLGCVVYVYYLIPETRGRSLEHMSAIFADKGSGTSATDADTGACAIKGAHHLEAGVKVEDRGTVELERGFNACILAGAGRTGCDEGEEAKEPGPAAEGKSAGGTSRGRADTAERDGTEDQEGVQPAVVYAPLHCTTGSVEWHSNTSPRERSSGQYSAKGHTEGSWGQYEEVDLGAAV
jgi:hypothetical protein